MKTLARLALVTLLTLLTSTLYAESKPTLSAETNAVLLSKYKSVLLAQKTTQEKVAEFNAEYQKALAGLPKGAGIIVNPETDTVEVKLPEEKTKPEETLPTQPVKK